MHDGFRMSLAVGPSPNSLPHMDIIVAAPLARFRNAVAMLQLAGICADALEESKRQSEGQEKGIPRASIEQL